MMVVVVLVIMIKMIIVLMWLLMLMMMMSIASQPGRWKGLKREEIWDKRRKTSEDQALQVADRRHIS